jgi:predicted DNA-binding transcriptional regulator YafY
MNARLTKRRKAAWHKAFMARAQKFVLPNILANCGFFYFERSFVISKFIIDIFKYDFMLSYLRVIIIKGGERMQSYQIQRLFGIIYILLNKKTVTAKELAEQFEVSTRTIMRDIETLSEAGIPICTTKGNGGGVSLMEGYVLNKTAISSEEQEQILLALQSLSKTELSESNSALAKLRAIFGKQSTDWLEVDFSSWRNPQFDKARFDLLKQAITERKVIKILYAGSNGETAERKVEAVKLLFKARAWYLQAFCLLKQDYRTFKVNRILSAELTTETFNEREYPVGVPELIFPDEAMITLKLRCSPKVAYRLYDEFTPDSISRSDDGSLLVETKVPDKEGLTEFLLSFGSDVTVLEPQSAKGELFNELEKIKNLYQI